MSDDAGSKRAPMITALALAPDESLLAVGSQAGLEIRSASNAVAPAASKLESELEHILAISFAPHGLTFAAAGGSPAESGSVELWDWKSRKRIGVLEGHTDVVNDVAWLDEGKSLATASADKTVRRWNVAERKCSAVFQGHSAPVLAVAAAPDGKLLCSGGGDQTIRVWNAKGDLVRVFSNHLGSVQSLAFAPPTSDGRPPLMASAGADGTIRVWQPSIGRMVRIVRHPAPVMCARWQNDGRAILSGSEDGCLRQVAADSDAVLAEKLLGRGAINVLSTDRDGHIHCGTAHGCVLTVNVLPRSP